VTGTVSNVDGPVWPERRGHPSETLLIALRSLGTGVAVLDRSGCVLTIDDRFLALHRIDPATAAAERPSDGWPWGDLLASSACGLAGDDARTLALAWATLDEDASRGVDGSRTLRLGDGRALEITRALAVDGTTVLTITDVTGSAKTAGEPAVPSHLTHDMNNLLGGILANLHLCLTDTAEDHPARPRLETVNRAAIDLRSLIRQLATTARESE